MKSPYGVGCYCDMAVSPTRSHLLCFQHQQKRYMSLFQISNSSNSDPIKRMSKRRDTKVSVLVLWMNIAFFTCWMPYGIVALCYIFGGEGFVNPLIVVIPLLASKSSVCWNPMLYIVMNFQVRLKLKLRPFGFFLVFWSTMSQQHDRNCVLLPMTAQLGNFDRQAVLLSVEG